ncbi:MAG: TonB-dependent receptor [Flavobacteriales bacterium]|nr:TonB-dependent receptor [Flavobacteriales bacterium]MBL6872440.1 TonB-dependent receptor [Flavobacteriales bacterium]
MIKQIFLLFLPFYCFSQFSGTVKDSENQPLAGVDVLVSSTMVLAQTDSEGQFSLSLDIPKNTLIFFSKETYESKTIQYSSEKEISIQLNKLHVDIDEVVVSSINQKLSSNQTVNIQSKKMSQLNESSFDLGESISKLSGVDQTSTGAGIKKIVVRGLSGMRVVTLVNGVRIENQQWGGDHGIGFTDLGFGKVELVKGPASIIFGADALGGALYFSDENYISGGKPRSKIISTFESSNMRINNQLGVKWTTKGFKTNTLIGYGSAADYQLPNGLYLFNSRYSNQAFKTSLGYNTDKWIVNLRYQYNYSILGIPAHSHAAEPTLEQLSSSSQDRYPTRPTQFNTQQILNLENTFFIADNILNINLSQFVNRLEEYEAWNVPELDVTLASTQLNGSYSVPFGKGFNWTLGTQLGQQQNTNKEARTLLIPDGKTTDFGAYSLLEYAKNSVSSQLGLRFDKREIQLEDNTFSKGFDAFSATIGLSKKAQKHHFRATYSSAFRTPHFSELLAYGVHHGTKRFEIGDRNLIAEKGHQLDIAYEWTSEHLGLIINPYFHLINDFIALIPKDSIIDYTPVYTYEQVDNVSIKGIEMNVHYHPHFAHHLHFEESLTIMEGKEGNSFLALMPAHKSQTLVRYYFDKTQKKVQLHNTFFEYVYTAAQEKVVENETPSKAYGLFNLGMNISIDKLPNFELTIGVKNVTNKSYISHLSRLKSYEIPHEGRSYFIKLCSTF